jgi:hypothetical protein
MKKRAIRSAERFIETNWKSLKSRADSILGLGNYNIEELRSVALLSYYKFNLDWQLNEKSKADRSTAFLFYLEKQLHGQMELIAFSEDNKRHTRSEQEEGTDFETKETMLDMWADGDDKAEPIWMCPEPVFEEEIPSNGGHHFSINIDSFANMRLSPPLLEALALLTTTDHSLRSVGKIVGSMRPEQIPKKIRSILANELNRKGAKIYKGECLNGKRSNVIVCASSEKEAHKYFKPYGRLLKCLEINMQSLQ